MNGSPPLCYRARILHTLLGLLAVLPLSLPATLHADTEPSRQLAVPNAEDLALLKGGRWVIASSMPGGNLKQGALYAIDSRSGTVHKLYPNSANSSSTTADCASEVPPEKFAPHGIAIQNIAGRQQLFVVNHGARESIELFDIESSTTPTLNWRGCIHYPNGAMGNAVAVTPEGQLFATNMGAAADGSPRTKKWMGDVLQWNEADGWRTIPGSDIFAPNGLLVSDDATQFFVASWAASEVIKLTRSSDGTDVKRQTVKLPFLPDNLRQTDDGTIIAAGLRGTAQDVVHCMMTPGICDIVIPTAIATLRSEDLQPQCIRHLKLRQGTVALPVGDALWVGPVRGESIWVLAGDRQGWDACR